MKEYMAKPDYFKAIQLTRENLHEIYSFIKYPKRLWAVNYLGPTMKGVCILIDRHDGGRYMSGGLNVGEYVTKNKKGEILVYTKEAFDEKFTLSNRTASSS